MCFLLWGISLGLSLGGGKGGGGGYWCESDWCGGDDSGLVDDIISKTFVIEVVVMTVAIYIYI